MLRRLFLPMLASLFCAVPALAQITPDRVFYRDREGKIANVDGEIKESAIGVQVIGPNEKRFTAIALLPIINRIFFARINNFVTRST